MLFFKEGVKIIIWLGIVLFGDSQNIFYLLTTRDTMIGSSPKQRLTYNVHRQMMGKKSKHSICKITVQRRRKWGD